MCRQEATNKAVAADVASRSAHDGAGAAQGEAQGGAPGSVPMVQVPVVNSSFMDMHMGLGMMGVSPMGVGMGFQSGMPMGMRVPMDVGMMGGMPASMGMPSGVMGATTGAGAGYTATMAAMAHAGGAGVGSGHSPSMQQGGGTPLSSGTPTSAAASLAMMPPPGTWTGAGAGAGGATTPASGLYQSSVDGSASAMQAQMLRGQAPGSAMPTPYWMHAGVHDYAASGGRKRSRPGTAPVPRSRSRNGTQRSRRRGDEGPRRPQHLHSRQRKLLFVVEVVMAASELATAPDVSVRGAGVGQGVAGSCAVCALSGSATV